MARAFLKHSVPHVSEYPKHWPFSSHNFFKLFEPVTNCDTLEEMAVCNDGL
jgi:hypothetical protein